MPLQPVITRDNVQLEVHPMALYKVTDSMLAVYEVQNLYSSIQILISTTLSDIIGRITLDDTLCSRQEVRRQVFNQIHSTIQNWGALLIEVDILEIDPPENIVTAMEAQLLAERERRAKLVEADADRQIKKIMADSLSQEKIQLVTGESQSMVMIAEAEAEGQKAIGMAQAEVIGMLSGKVKGFDVGDFQLKNYWLDAIEAVAINSRNVQLVKGVSILQKLSE
eukprot:EST42686.1 SPFH domain/Band 7 family protein [Spironucleus salmonicida]